MAQENKSKVSILTNGIIKENPVLRLVLGTCSILAVTTAVSSALGMGAAWNFVIWGLYFALLLILEKVWLLEILKKSHVLNRIYVLTAAVISFVIFDATDMSQAFSYLKAMFGTGGYPLISAACSYYFRSYFVVLMIALLGATPIPKSFYRQIQQWKTGTAVMLFAEPLALSALLLICTAFLVDGSFNPFLYFRF